MKTQELQNSVKLADVYLIDEGFKFYQCNQYNQIHNTNLINNHFQTHSTCNYLNIANIINKGKRPLETSSSDSALDLDQI
jgi:hypothetical protein